MYEIHDSPRSVTLRQKTHIAQKLPADVEQKVENFHSFVLKQKKCHEIPPCSHWEHGWNPHFIWSPAQLDSLFQRPENHHSENDRLAELLCQRDKATYGSLQTKHNAKRKVCSRHIGPRHEKGWMTEELCDTWLRKVWQKWPGASLQKNSLLVSDMFQGHLAEKWRKTTLHQL